VAPLVELANGLGVHVRGLSFHVGSQVADSSKYVEAIDACREVMQQLATAVRARQSSSQAAD
jgi:ornithine decarboxylase